MDYLIGLWNNLIDRLKKIGIKKIVIIILTVVVVFITISVITRAIQDKVMENKVKNKTYTSMADFESVQEVVIYMGGKYISEEDKGDTRYIYLDFNKDLYEENGNSNKVFFENIASYIAYVLKYKNFVMIDDSRKITIEIGCDKEAKQFKTMIINGNNNYFAEEDAKRQLDKYTETNNTELNINSNIINQLIKNDWNPSKVKFGTKESMFEKYEIYFDEGIEVKTVGNKVFNIVLTDKYTETIVNNIKVGESFENIKKTLGTPTFEQTNIIGYQNNDIYIFFGKDEVSIYRNEKNENEEFVKLINKLNEETDINKIANELTDIWSDHDEYINEGNAIKITYSLRGVQLTYNTSSKNGIILYNNYVGKIKDNKTLKDISKDEIPQNVYIDATNNLIFIGEQIRASKIGELQYRSSLQMNNNNDNGLNKKSNQFNYYIGYENNIRVAKFYNENKDYPKTELEADINSYMWFDDYRFIYSVKNDGIYVYDLKTRNSKKLIDGSEDFTFKSYESNVLKYDNDKTLEFK